MISTKLYKFLDNFLKNFKFIQTKSRNLRVEIKILLEIYIFMHYNQEKGHAFWLAQFRRMSGFPNKN